MTCDPRVEQQMVFPFHENFQDFEEFSHFEQGQKVNLKVFHKPKI